MRVKLDGTALHRHRDKRWHFCLAKLESLPAIVAVYNNTLAKIVNKHIGSVYGFVSFLLWKLLIDAITLDEIICNDTKYETK